jgi:hypothetical protein
MGFSTTGGQLYIVELSRPFERVEIQFAPQVLNWNREADISSVYIVGRNHPKQHFTGGSETLSFQMDFYSDVEDRKDVIKKVNWLRSLTFGDGSFGPARNVKLVWGDLYKNNVWAVKSVNVKLENFAPQKGWLPQQAWVDISLIADPKKNLRISDIRKAV